MLCSFKVLLENFDKFDTFSKFSIALEKGLILLSRDRDFLDSVLFPPAQFSGIIVLTSHPPRAEKLVKAMDLLLSKVTEFKGKLFIADEEGFEEKN